MRVRRSASPVALGPTDQIGSGDSSLFPSLVIIIIEKKGIDHAKNGSTDE
jgi:hypothetical protein